MVSSSSVSDSANVHDRDRSEPDGSVKTPNQNPKPPRAHLHALVPRMSFPAEFDPEPPPVQLLPCPNFARTGKCALAELCVFSHGETARAAGKRSFSDAEYEDADTTGYVPPPPPSRPPKKSTAALLQEFSMHEPALFAAEMPSAESLDSTNLVSKAPPAPTSAAPATDSRPVHNLYVTAEP